VTRGEIAEIKPSTAFPGRHHVFEIVQKNGVIWYCQAKSSVCTIMLLLHCVCLAAGKNPFNIIHCKNLSVIFKLYCTYYN